ncbi:Hypothetical predicted protein [Pelobates cultripes]|uniref:TNFR-Cys domain-containing protein n=1 Tax=Pelobates cultripes TaxID=61616 RepID=A0AAD1VXH1_PELCU|nr:Hypothetical predicted protein [Pelobates cultripes]
MATAVQAHASKDVPQWVDIEASWACPRGLKYLFWIPHRYRKLHQDVPPTTRLLLKVWDTATKQWGQDKGWAQATPLYSLYLANPAFDYRPWTSRGCVRVSHLYDQNKLLDFPDLQRKYSLPHNTIFQYLQLKSMLQGSNSPTATANTKHIDQMCTATTQPKKLLSTLYNMLIQSHADPPDKFKSDCYYKANNQCEKCDSGCQLCDGTGLDGCLECPSNTLQVEGTTHCLAQCPERFYLYKNLCKKCHPSCKTCNGSSVQDCLTCDQGSEFKAGICYPQCEEQRYPDDNGVCQPCDSSCRHCSGPGPDHCISCKINSAWSPTEMRCTKCCDSQSDQDDCCFCDVNSVIALSSTRKEKKAQEKTQDKSLTTYFSPQPHKTLNHKMTDMDLSSESTESEGIKNHDKELITISLLHTSLKANLEEIKSELAVMAIEIKSDIKKEINILAAKLDGFEVKLHDMDLQVNHLNDDYQLALRKISDLEFKVSDLEDRSRQKNLRFRNLPEKGTHDNAKQIVIEYISALGITYNSSEQLIERCHRLFKPKSLQNDLPRDIMVCFFAFDFKESILKAARLNPVSSGPFQNVKVFQDLSFETRSQCKKFSSATQILRTQNIRYRWLFPSKLSLTHEGKREVFDSNGKLTEWLKRNKILV